MHLPYAKIASARDIPNIDPSPRPQKPKQKPSTPTSTGVAPDNLHIILEDIAKIIPITVVQ